MALPRCRLRAYRKSAGLSQKELAALLGIRSQGLMSELECGKKRPGIEVLIASERIFGAPAGEIFPSLASRIERGVLERSQKLPAASPGRSGARKRQTLAAIITRLSHSNV